MNSESPQLSTTAQYERFLLGDALDAAPAVTTPTIIDAMLASGKGISDLIFSPARPPQVEQHGELTPVEIAGLSPLQPADISRIARDLIGGNNQALRTLTEQGACDFAYSLPQRSRFPGQRVPSAQYLCGSDAGDRLEDSHARTQPATRAGRGGTV